MAKNIKDTLHDFASEFASHHTEDGDNYWWGHDTNLGDMEQKFDQALAEIKRIIEEAKPEERNLDEDLADIHRKYRIGVNDGVSTYHTNLLKALGE